MTTAFKEAIKATAKLSPDETRALVEFLLPDDPAIDARWAQLFEDSRETLDAMAEEALAEHRAGQTLPLDLDDDF